MATSEKKYQKLFEEAQADAIRFRQERDAALGVIRMIGRLAEDPRIVGACKAAMAGKELPNDDTVRLDAVIEAEADIEKTLQETWQITGAEEYEDADLRKAIDKMIARNAAFRKEMGEAIAASTPAVADKEPEPNCECRYTDVDQVDASE